MNLEGEVFRTPKEIAFTSGYLHMFFWEMFHSRGCDDEDIHLKLLKQTCDRILPNRLWDIYERGESLHMLSLSSNEKKEKEVDKAYDKGMKSGADDSIGMDDGIVPSNLLRYLIGKKLVGLSFD